MLDWWRKSRYLNIFNHFDKSWNKRFTHRKPNSAESQFPKHSSKFKFLFKCADFSPPPAAISIPPSPFVLRQSHLNCRIWGNVLIRALTERNNPGKKLKKKKKGSVSYNNTCLCMFFLVSFALTSHILFQFLKIYTNHLR